MSPMVGVCGETGDVLALRARGGSANPGRAMGSFIDECVAAIPTGCRDDYQLWVRVDSAGYRADVVEAAERHNAAFTVTAKGYPNVRAAIETVALDPATVWSPALGAEDAKGSGLAVEDLRPRPASIALALHRPGPGGPPRAVRPRPGPLCSPDPPGSWAWPLHVGLTARRAAHPRPPLPGNHDCHSCGCRWARTATSRHPVAVCGGRRLRVGDRRRARPPTRRALAVGAP